MMRTRLERHQHDRLFLGVCGGLAQHYGISSALVRLAFVLLALASGAGLALYAVLAMMLPDHHYGGETSGPAHRSLDDDAETAPQGARQPTEPWQYRASLSGAEHHRRNTVAFLLMAGGATFLLFNFGAFGWFRWGAWWPVLFIAFGMALVAVRFRRA